jgi:hypothetical protein
VVMAAQWTGLAAMAEHGISASTALLQWKLLNTVDVCSACLAQPAKDALAACKNGAR